MDSGYGFFHVISGYFSFPYRSDSIHKFLQFLSQHGIVSGLSFYKVRPSMLTYDSIMDGLPEKIAEELFAHLLLFGQK